MARFEHRTGWAAVAAMGFAAFSGVADASATHADDLVSREVFFADPERAGVRLSPDGSTLSFLAPLDGVLNIWVAPVDEPDNARAITSDTNRGIRQYFWTYNGTHVVYLQDTDGDENFLPYAVHVESGDVRGLAPFENTRAFIQEVSWKHPDEILVGLNNRVPQFHDLHRINVVTGESELVFQNDGWAGVVTDSNFGVRFTSRYDQDGSIGYYSVDNNEVGDMYMRVPADDTLTTSIVGFDNAGETMYMLDSRRGDTAALYAQPAGGGEPRLLFADDRADVSGVMANPRTGRVEAAASTYDRARWTILDEAIEPDFETLRTVRDAEFSVTSRTLDDRRWIVAFTRDDGPLEYWLYDRDDRKASYLFSNRPALDGVTLSKMHSVVIEARDGLQLVSYLTMPHDADATQKAGDPRAAEPLPMVLLVHGGPWARDAWGYNSFHQWLASRGYAVLSVNFRGSTGFGKSFINAGDREWAAAMHDDLLDAVQWAVGRDIADPDRVAIMGGSYGGYATLVGLTFTPDTFAAGVSIVGPSNLNTLLSSIPPYWAPAVELFRRRVGDHTTEDGQAFLKARSPLTHAERISKPLLIGQGAQDPRVKQAESDQIVEAMTAKKLPVTYVLFPDEGHGFARPENRMAFNAVAEVFLAQHLGGRYEPIGDDFEGSSISVPEGAEGVPGVAAELGGG
ncbi:MAG: S9 family peptidase [Planctomycetota bacterium]